MYFCVAINIGVEKVFAYRHIHAKIRTPQY